MKPLALAVAALLTLALPAPGAEAPPPPTALEVLQAGARALAWSPYRFDFELVTHDAGGETRRLTGSAVARPYPDGPSSYRVEARLTGPQGLDMTFQLASVGGQVNVLDNAVATLWQGESPADGEGLVRLYLGELLPLVLDASQLRRAAGFHAEFGSKIRGGDVLCQEIVQPTANGGRWSYAFDPLLNLPCQLTHSVPGGDPPNHSVLTIKDLTQVVALRAGELTIRVPAEIQSQPFVVLPED